MMNELEMQENTDLQRARRQKRQEQRRRKRRQRNIRLLVLAALAVFAVTFSVKLYAARSGAGGTASAAATVDAAAPAQSSVSSAAEADAPPPSAAETGDTLALTGEIASNYGIVVDLDSGKILAEKNAQARISPASMTKILTLLVASEHIADPNGAYTITTDITDYCYRHDCSTVGFEDGETVPVRDLLYGTILPSGADAALGLADYVAGSQDAFVALMNEKLDALGLSDSAHFTNCIGVYDENHYCTVYDMAMILSAAAKNDLCREVLSAHTYTTSATAQHPSGLTISNWFLRRIEDKDTGGLTVLYAKTGFVTQSGNCAASLASGSGRNLLCVTADAWSAWRCIYDHVALYKQFSVKN